MDERPGEKQLNFQLPEIEGGRQVEAKSNLSSQNSSQQAAPDERGPGSAQMYDLKVRRGHQVVEEGSLLPEARGMARLYRHSTPEKRRLLRLPSLSGYTDLEEQLDPELLQEVLNLAFMDYLKQEVSPTLYRYFLNQRRRFGEAVGQFGQTGDLRHIVAALEQQSRLDPVFLKMVRAPD